jgi:hypothetical protein
MHALRPSVRPREMSLASVMNLDTPRESDSGRHGHRHAFSAVHLRNRSTKAASNAQLPECDARAKTMIVLVIIGALVLTGCARTARVPVNTHNNSSSYAAYPALALAQPSGITVVSLAQARLVADSKAHPIWVDVTPENANAVLPEIRSARELRHERSRHIWISKSSRGGICLLVYDPALSPNPATDHSITATCGDSSELSQGMTLLQRPDLAAGAKRLFIFGVVPRGATGVRLS